MVPLVANYIYIICIAMHAPYLVDDVDNGSDLAGRRARLKHRHRADRDEFLERLQSRQSTGDILRNACRFEMLHCENSKFCRRSNILFLIIVFWLDTATEWSKQENDLRELN